ncbi:hypothetical protein L873DRAFT_22716 [Choiromyces venosus 120613-1]|uniref:Amino acid permease/ SLC12A domain-containing protein n=1 Tax=Choiromyces venosus 120613-1 TaxID=1336337 RepID=A0A3N4K6B1_9PEZI|nr:hypothetical protein L873DRAFT_22716 [Choiromyces venosus 120613-1]
MSLEYYVMTSAWSCGNSYVYSASRTLYALALNNKTPKIFKKCLSSGVPIYCVLFVALTSLISFLSVSNSTSTVFGWLFVNMRDYFYNLYPIPTMQIQGVGMKNIYHRTPFHLQPYAAYVGFTFCFLILFSMGLTCSGQALFQCPPFLHATLEFSPRSPSSSFGKFLRKPSS